MQSGILEEIKIKWDRLIMNKHWFALRVRSKSGSSAAENRLGLALGLSWFLHWVCPRFAFGLDSKLWNRLEIALESTPKVSNRFYLFIKLLETRRISDTHEYKSASPLICFLCKLGVYRTDHQLDPMHRSLFKTFEPRTATKLSSSCQQCSYTC